MFGVGWKTVENGAVSGRRRPISASTGRFDGAGSRPHSLFRPHENLPRFDGLEPRQFQILPSRGQRTRRRVRLQRRAFDERAGFEIAGRNESGRRLDGGGRAKILAVQRRLGRRQFGRGRRFAVGFAPTKRQLRVRAAASGIFKNANSMRPEMERRDFRWRRADVFFRARSGAMKAPDVSIVGGGVIGLSCAFELAKRDGKIVVFEKNATGNEASFAAGGMLAPLCESVVHPWNVAPERAAQMLEFAFSSRDGFPEFAEQLCELSGIDVELCLQNSPTCDWREAGILYWPSVEKDDQKSAQLLKKGGQNRLWNGKNGVWLKEEGQVDNRKLVAALRAACLKLGVEIRENVASQLCLQHGRAAGLKIGSEIFESENVLVCAGAWSEILTDLPVFPLAGQMIQLRAQRLIPHVIYSDDCYLVPRRDGRLLVGATVENAGFEKKVTAGGVSQLLKAALRIEPRLANCELENSWAGLRPASSDGLPILGRGKIQNLFFATGHGRNGILLAPQTSKLLAAAILDGANVPSAFSPHRF